MSSAQSVDLRRRKFLTLSATAVGGLGVALTAVPFLSYWQPDAATVAAGAPVDVNIGAMQLGQLLIVPWRGKPVWIVKRDEQTLATLSDHEDRLRDPNSVESIQPDYAVNTYRSIKPTFFVAVGVCTHLGCSPTYRPDISPADLGASWDGGFFCPCHGSKFDLAGRVYKGVPAPTNLEIPPYRYLDDGTIRVGEGQANA